MPAESNITYRVVGVRPETADTATITLALPLGGYPDFIAGQYITVYFPDTGTPEGKAYTISSAPCEQRFTITVKAIGEFSNRLVALQAGDTVIGSLPYGYYYSEATDNPLVLIAGGIGVTPFRSMVVESLHQNPARPITLFVSTRTQAGAVFMPEFTALAQAHSTVLTVHHFVTREEDVAAGVTAARLSGAAILETLERIGQSEFFICGSITFVRALWRDLCSAGVSEDMIMTEAFFSH